MEIYEDLLVQFTKMSRETLKDNLVGIYLHGSAAMDCFNPQKSDLDLILVVQDGLSDDDKMTFMENVVKLNEKAPEKGIELSIVKKEFCDSFVYPTPFELHFSVTHLSWFKQDPITYISKMKGEDKDLAAHFTILKKYGIVLYGEEINEVLGNVPREDYIDSIWCDVEAANQEILDNPVYITLNLCRGLAYLQDDLILSKKAGGEWGIRTLPQKFHGLIKEALRSYASDQAMAGNLDNAADFADYMLERINFIAKNSRR